VRAGDADQSRYRGDGGRETPIGIDVEVEFLLVCGPAEGAKAELFIVRGDVLRAAVRSKPISVRMASAATAGKSGCRLRR